MRILKRRAASPVLAEFALLCVVVVIALPLGSFVFGLLGSETQKAEVAITSSSCSAGGPSTTSCHFLLTNLGTANAQFQPYTIVMVLGGNQTRQDSSSACTGEGGNTIMAGSTLKVDCSFSLVPGSAGDQYTGWLSLPNIGWIPFGGKF